MPSTQDKEKTYSAKGQSIALFSAILNQLLRPYPRTFKPLGIKRVGRINHIFA
jgi:hypothetical protein